MSDDNESFAIPQVADAAERAVARTREFLGVSFGAFTCPDCGQACEPSETYDVNRAAFHNGNSPTWYCGNCEKHFVRESNDVDTLTGDMYGRGDGD